MEVIAATPAVPAPVRSYPVRVGVETDIWLNVLAGGRRGETISLRAARAEERKRLWGCWMCAYLGITVERGIRLFRADAIAAWRRPEGDAFLAACRQRLTGKAA